MPAPRTAPIHVPLLLTLAFVLAVCAPAPVAGQYPDPVVALHEGDLEALGGSERALIDVMVVLRGLNETDCKLQEWTGTGADPVSFLRTYNRLMESDGEAILAQHLWGLHPTFRRLFTWLAVNWSEECDDPALQQLYRNSVRYIMSYRDLQPTAEERREAAAGEWWADLELVRARPHDAYVYSLGRVRGFERGPEWVVQTGDVLRILNPEEVLLEIRERYGAVRARMEAAGRSERDFYKCASVADVSVLFDAEGMPVDMLGTYEGPNPSHRSRASWERARESVVVGPGCVPMEDALKAALRQVRVNPALAAGGLPVPVWVGFQAGYTARATLRLQSRAGYAFELMADGTVRQRSGRR